MSKCQSVGCSFDTFAVVEYPNGKKLRLCARHLVEALPYMGIMDKPCIIKTIPSKILKAPKQEAKNA